MKTLLSILFYLTASLSAFALDHGAGNGGDICEDRFQLVRDDLAAWIQHGGPTDLTLPKDVTVAQYTSAMLDAISRAEVNCVDQTIEVAGKEKTCENFRDANGHAQIRCNRQAFLGTFPDDQYVLVHHEYAGLAGFEVGEQGNSSYPLSNRITAYLESEVIRHLVVKQAGAKPTSNAYCASWFLASFRPKHGKPGSRVSDVFRGPTLSMAGSNSQRVSLPGYPAIDYLVNAKTDGEVEIFLDMSQQIDSPKGKRATYDIDSMGSGFATGESHAEVLYNNGYVGGMWMPTPKHPCKISAARVLCAATPERANDLVFRSVSTKEEPFIPTDGPLPEHCSL